MEWGFLGNEILCFRVIISEDMGVYKKMLIVEVG